MKNRKALIYLTVIPGAIALINFFALCVPQRHEEPFIVMLFFFGFIATLGLIGLIASLVMGSIKGQQN